MICERNMRALIGRDGILPTGHEAIHQKTGESLSLDVPRTALVRAAFPTHQPVPGRRAERPGETPGDSSPGAGKARKPIQTTVVSKEAILG